jgi:hypothetical protein
MNSVLEHHFRVAIQAGRLAEPRVSVREVIAGMKSSGLIASEKQAWRTLEKWARRREYSYGVTLDLGWLEYPR